MTQELVTKIFKLTKEIDEFDDLGLVFSRKCAESELKRQLTKYPMRDYYLIISEMTRIKSYDMRQLKLTDAELLSTFKDDADDFVREVATNKLSELNNDFSDALNQLSNQSLEL